MLKRIDALIIALLFAMAIFADGYALQASADTNAAAQAPAQSEHCHGHHHCGHCGAMSILAKISGKSVDELTKLYPQKTAWQIAKSMGRLDELKTDYLSDRKARIDKLVAEKKITAADGAAIYADLQKRVAAIDGVNIVVPGHGSFKKPMHKG